MTFKDAFNKYVQALKELAKWPGVESVNKELTKNCKPLYVDWHGDDNCTECFGEDCSTCSINLAHKYGAAECDPSEIDWPGDESCVECPDCDCENCSILLSHKDDNVTEEIEDDILDESGVEAAEYAMVTLARLFGEKNLNQ